MDTRCSDTHMAPSLHFRFLSQGIRSDEGNSWQLAYEYLCLYGAGTRAHMPEEQIAPVIEFIF